MSQWNLFSSLRNRSPRRSNSGTSTGRGLRPSKLGVEALESRVLLSANSRTSTANVGPFLPTALSVTVNGTIDLNAAASAIRDLARDGFKLDVSQIASALKDPNALRNYAKQFGIGDLKIVTNISNSTALPNVGGVVTIGGPSGLSGAFSSSGHRPIRGQTPTIAPGNYNFNFSIDTAGGHTRPAAHLQASLAVTVAANNTASFCFTLTASIGS